MPYYSDEIIEEVRSRSDIVDIVGSYVRLTKKGSTYFGLCPFHNEKTGSFSVSPNKQMFYCFGCGAGGNVFTFLMKYENYTFSEAVQELAGKAGVELPQHEMNAAQRREADLKTKLLEINKEAAKYFYSLLHSPRGQRALEYFKGRQLSEETMQKFGLGYSDQYSNDLYQYLKKKGYSDALLKESGLVTIDEARGGHDKFWNRAMFPIMDKNSKVIGFGGRVMGEGEPKYLNSPETKIFDKSRNLYGLHIAKSTRRPQLLLCEGYMDVISLHQAGFDNAVASLGTALTSGHASLLRRYTNEVYLTYDSDNAGVKAALRAIPILKEVGITTKVINMRPYKDPDEFMKGLGPEEYQKRIDNAENSFLFEIRMLATHYDLEDPTAKAQFYEAIAGRLLEFTEALERNVYLDSVCKTYGIPADDMTKRVNTLAMKNGGKPQAYKESHREDVTERRELKSGIHEKKKEDGLALSQKLLLTWMIDDVSLFSKLEGYIGPEDFPEGLFHQVAALVFEEYGREGSVQPAKLLNAFESEEEQQEIASLFHAKIHQVDTPAEKKKALLEVVDRVKQNSFDYRSSHLDPTDMVGLMQVINERNQWKKQLMELGARIE